ncbi:hypothetical protein [Streptomyces sp. VRA16 Mangrove soil]|uniref:hypothetical protein n=1 Tax=Streptomyces sp. VRA16 Mangrove soil TaxID=2817434 RepID=UPI001A9D0246|nr:hypothetical protein [Streptomyces sp. VRA16 Mangrove soil]MBO1330509.1 hypothetical protein [Streptomyces sp. VRA16 Mangrove soil]
MRDEWDGEGDVESETRVALLPDGLVVTIAVEPGTSQDEVAMLAVQAWQGLPEPDVPND